jgi:hypothetical protein
MLQSPTITTSNALQKAIAQPAEKGHIRSGSNVGPHLLQFQPIREEIARGVSQNTNDRGRFVIVKTRLTTKRRKKCEERGDYIYAARG